MAVTRRGVPRVRKVVKKGETGKKPVTPKRKQKTPVEGLIAHDRRRRSIFNKNVR